MITTGALVNQEIVKQEVFNQSAIISSDIELFQGPM